MEYQLGGCTRMEADASVVNCALLSVTSSVQQRLMLGPMLFVTDITNLDQNVVDMVNKFADGTKIGCIICSEKGYLNSQHDLDQLKKWAKDWQMECNLD